MNINVNVISPEKVSSSARRRYESQVCDVHVKTSHYPSGLGPAEFLDESHFRFTATLARYFFLGGKKVFIETIWKLILFSGH